MIKSIFVEKFSGNIGMNDRVFISYAREDKASAEKLYVFLKSNGFTPWMDKMDLLPGQKWDIAINAALKKTDFIILLLSRISVEKRGFIQKEFKLALDFCKEKLESDIFLIPFKP